MKKQRLTVLLAFSLLLVVATVIGCGTLGVDGFLIPTGGFEGKFVFVLNSDSDGSASSPMTINVYKMDSSTGMLTVVPGSPFQTGVSGACCEGQGRVVIDADPASQFVFVPLQGADGVEVYTVDQSSGALTLLSGSPFPTGGSNAFAAKLHPTGKFLYVANTNSDDISVFTVGANGALTAVGSPVPTADGDSPGDMTIDPQGRFLFVSHICCQTGSMDVFTINGTSGALTPVAGSPFPVCGNGFNECRGGVVDPSGTFLIVASPWSGPSHLSVQSINATSGVLTPVGTVNTGDGADTPVLVNVGGQAYVVVNDIYDADVSVFTFNTSTGALSAISGSPFKVDANWMWLHGLAVDPSGKFAYAVDFGTDCCANGPSIITGVTLDANGNPVQVPGSPFSNGSAAPTQIIVTH